MKWIHVLEDLISDPNYGTISGEFVFGSFILNPSNSFVWWYVRNEIWLEVSLLRSRASVFFVQSFQVL